ncbi:MAG: selenocysteine-specific translation elongation factor, partial [Armatimonadota bacterium]|nr:selenocysteine-specific translation elongation factor [Armatimonadota bacterium]
MSPQQLAATSPAYVLGTAGHIDHGKSALVKALTGIDPDRLEEEKRRGMTIDLGFAHLDLPSGRRVGIVDVPGHERLIKNMLAGAAGIDAVLLVVAADEGVMPQTREHLDILRLLDVRRGLVVLNKVDLVDDPAWLLLVEEDLDRLTAGSFLEGAPVVPVSARTGQGLDRLVVEIDRLLDTVAPRPAEGPVRLPIDRVFTMPGFGTVVTGTLWSGRVRPGETLEVLPGGLAVRVRQVERHGQRMAEVVAGSRAALNLAGVERGALERGMVLATPGTLTPAVQLDARVRVLPAAPPLPHLVRLRLYLGTAEAFCRLALLDRERLSPGEEALVQVRLERPIVAARGDRFVLRRTSPVATLGGGEVITVNPPRRRRGAQAVAEVSALSSADADTLVHAAIAARGVVGAAAQELAPTLAQNPEAVARAAARLVAQGRVIQVRERLFDAAAVDRVTARVRELLVEAHQQMPWRMGVPREELKTRAAPGADDRLFAAVLDRLLAAGTVAVTRGLVHLGTHRPVFAPEEESLRRAILHALGEGRFSPPTLQEVGARLGSGPAFARMVQSLLEEGALVEVAPGIVFAAEIVEEVARRVVAMAQATGEVTVAQVRDALGTSRKFALALLEYFDGIRLTRRLGDR